VSKVIWQKAASPYCRSSRRRMQSSDASAGQAHSPAAAGERCAMHSCVSALTAMSGNVPQKCSTAPFRGRAGPHLKPSNIAWAEWPIRKSATQTACRSLQPFMHSSPLCPTHTHRHTDHATCDTRSNSLHLCTACS